MHDKWVTNGMESFPVSAPVVCFEVTPHGVYAFLKNGNVWFRPSTGPLPPWPIKPSA